VKPNLVIYNTLLSASAKGKQPCERRRYLFQMMEQGVTPDEISFFSAIDACASFQDPAPAVQWLGRIGYHAGVAPDVVTFYTLINISADQTGTRRVPRRCMELSFL
jgi:pentatricopeptide repeat protein